MSKVDPLLLLVMFADDNRMGQYESMDVAHEASRVTHEVSRVHFNYALNALACLPVICIT